MKLPALSTLRILLIPFLFSLSVGPAFGAMDMFLELDGIEGESKDEGHMNHIDVLAWSWGVEQSVTADTGGVRRTGQANVGDLMITKYVDKSTPDLFLRCLDGRHISSGKLFVRRAGTTPQEFLVFRLERIIVSSVSTGGSGGEDRLTENVSLNFGKVEIDYTVFLEDGTALPIEKIGWDVESGQNL